MKYLTKHETTAAYNAVKDNLEKPHVALIKETNGIDYQKIQPIVYEAIDLGLPSGTKWSNLNVGARSITSFGNYYQYGKGAATYQTTSGDSAYEGTENPLALSADTAAQVMGGNWHMPTLDQVNELTANTDYEWTTINGVNGGKFINRNDSSKYIFVPAAGKYNLSQELIEVGTTAYLWTNKPASGPIPVYEFIIYSQGTMTQVDNRSYGFTIRGVLG